MPRYGRPTQITAARAKRYGRARGSTRPRAVAAAIDEVACAEGKESFVGARASGGCSSISGRLPADRDLDEEVDPDRDGPGGARQQPLASAAVVDRRADGTGRRPRRPRTRPAMPSARIATLHRLLMAVAAQRPQHRLVGVAERREHGVAPPPRDERAGPAAGESPVASLLRQHGSQDRRLRARDGALPSRPRRRAAPGPRRLPAVGVDLLRAREVALECLVQLGGEALVPDPDRDLVVELERAVVEVHRAHRRPGAVDQSVLACSIVGWNSNRRTPASSSWA